MNKGESRKWRQWGAVVLPLLFITLITIVAFGTTLVSDMVINLIEWRTGKELWGKDRFLDYAVAAAMAGFAVWGLSLIIATVRSRFLRLHAFVTQANRVSRRVVIMGLSIPRPGLVNQDGTLNMEYSGLKTLLARNFDAASDSIPAMEASGLLIQSATGFAPDSPGLINWVQNLRALRPHIDVLETVVIVPSPESARCSPAFADFLTRALKTKRPNVDILVYNTPCSYSEFSAVSDALDGAFLMAQEHHRTHEQPERRELRSENVCIDATSGTGAFSIAAGVQTLNTDMLYSYVTSYEKASDTPGGKAKIFRTRLGFTSFIEVT